MGPFDSIKTPKINRVNVYCGEMNDTVSPILPFEFSSDHKSILS